MSERNEAVRLSELMSSVRVIECVCAVLPRCDLYSLKFTHGFTSCWDLLPRRASLTTGWLDISRVDSFDLGFTGIIN